MSDKLALRRFLLSVSANMNFQGRGAMQTIRWGILGAAKFAREHMGPAIHAAGGAELAALATSSAEKAAAFQSFCPGL